MTKKLQVFFFFEKKKVQNLVSAHKCAQLNFSHIVSLSKFINILKIVISHVAI